jgi:hypothetical protein
VSPRRPVNRKVYASTAGSGAGVTISACVVWAVGVLFYGGDNTAAGAVDAALAVPAPLTAVLVLLVTAGGTLASGYIAKES